jgi:DUF1680 family protein
MKKNGSNPLVAAQHHKDSTMNRTLTCFVALLLIASWLCGSSNVMASESSQRPIQTKRPFAKLQPVPFFDVQLTDGFWGPWLKASRETTIPHSVEQCEKTGRIKNFETAAKKLANKEEGKYVGLWFNDSDVYKIVEGMSCHTALKSDPELEKQTDKLVKLLADAQCEDGYLDTYFTIERQDERFKHIYKPARHELYCMGHLIEAGVIRYQATGKKDLLDVAIKLADHIDEKFGPDARPEVPEHEELELALVELYRVTGEKKYLDLGKWFIDQRGVHEKRVSFGPENQDHLPVRKQTEIVGHAVRAMYLCMSMADVYQETGDKELLDACRELWESTIHRKLYVTGGIGATGHFEAFSGDYELPNLAYSETCAQIGLVLFAYRMLQIDPQAEYADVLERALYNGTLSGINLKGDRFFYRNRLVSDGKYCRSPWMDCSCCPSNVARFVPQVGRLFYSTDPVEKSLYVHLYGNGSVETMLGGEKVNVTQKTDYPWKGHIELTVDPGKPCEFGLCLRVPGWMTQSETPGKLYRMTGATLADAQMTLKINGEAAPVGDLEDGYCRVGRKWKKGDVVEIDFPMPIRRVYSHEKVETNKDHVALQRGPIVYCVETLDIEGPLDELILSPETKLFAQHRPGMPGGVTVITDSETAKKPRLLAIPYYARDNRGSTSMKVWLPEKKISE